MVGPRINSGTEIGMPNSSSRVIESFTARNESRPTSFNGRSRSRGCSNPSSAMMCRCRMLRTAGFTCAPFRGGTAVADRVVEVSGEERRSASTAGARSACGRIWEAGLDFNGSQTIGTPPADGAASAAGPLCSGEMLSSHSAKRPAMSWLIVGPLISCATGTGIPNSRSRLFERLTDINESSPISLSGRSGSISSTKPSASLICCCSRLDSCSGGLPFALWDAIGATATRAALCGSTAVFTSSARNRGLPILAAKVGQSASATAI